MLGSLPPWSDTLDKNIQYWMAFVAQLLAGLGNPMAVSVSTKVSQHWFTGAERILVTIIITMSSPFGVMIGMSVTPFIVDSPGDIPLMNWIWSIPSFITMAMLIVLVKSSHPPTPPSRSADVVHHPGTQSFFGSIKELFANHTYLLLCWVIGSAVGFFNCFATQLEQIMCAGGYSDEFSGLCVTFFILAGTVGSIIIGFIAEKTNQLQMITKISCGLAVILTVGLFFMLRLPHKPAAVMTLCVL